MASSLPANSSSAAPAACHWRLLEAPPADWLAAAAAARVLLMFVSLFAGLITN